MVTPVANKAGIGETMAVIFRDRDPQERKALQMAQRLARLGRRSLYIVTILSALWDVYYENGDVPELTEVVNAIHGLKKKSNGSGK